jgi:hypothetical protein
LAKTNASLSGAEERFHPLAPAANRPVAVSGHVVSPPTDSPARALQRELSDRLSAQPLRKWSARSTLLFVFVTCGAFWIALGAILANLIH